MAMLLDSLMALAAPAAGALSRRVIESDDAIARGIRASLASVLAGLVAKSDDAAAARQLFDLIASPDNDPSLASNPDELVRALATQGTPGPGRSLLDTIFDGRTAAVGDAIARTAGFRKPASGSSLLAMAASLVLGFFGTKVREGDLTADGLTSMLVAERDDILAAAPPGLMDVVEGREPDATDSDPFAAAAATISSTHAGPPDVRDVGLMPARRTGWVWPLTGLAAVVLIWLAFCSPSIG